MSDMGKHTKLGQAAVKPSGEVKDLPYWHRMLMTARTEGYPMHEELIYKEIDRLLDAKLATR